MLYSSRDTEIVEGDTLDFNNVRVRLAMVNTPETGETGYEEAKMTTESECPIGSNALVDEDDGQKGGDENPLIRYGLERVTWRHHQHDRQFHLKKIPLDSGSEIADVPSHWHIPVTQEFDISIKDFAKDIRDSAMGLNG